MIEFALGIINSTPYLYVVSAMALAMVAFMVVAFGAFVHDHLDINWY